MHRKPLLSIIVTIRNQRDIIESTLSALYEMKTVPFELYLMEDASADGSNDALHSLLDYYQHERTYYFEHTEPAGRGSCLNEALHQCTGSILWIPESIDSIDETSLDKAVSQLRESNFTYFCSDAQLPSSTKHWVEFTGEQTWPSDGDFLWNLSRISSEQKFFNPYTNRHQSLELAARLNASESLKVERWHRPLDISFSSEIASQDRNELAYTLLRTQVLSPGQRSRIYGFLSGQGSSNPGPKTAKADDKLLEEAIKMKQDGRFSAALELVEHVLSQHPGYQPAKQLKLEILERKRRFVEASELKHEMNASEKSRQSENPAGTQTIKTSIIIPTTLYGKPALEHCLVTLSKHCKQETTELIIIDNASLDDTHDYLRELQDKHFFHCKVVTNKQNAGFSASVNQGLEKAEGQYACIMHNDVELRSDVLNRLEHLMDTHPEFALIGPLANQTLNPGQSTDVIQTEQGDGLLEAEYLDSFCMMVRMDTGLRMDEAYQLAYFEDIDLCLQARTQGHKVGIATGLVVEHHFGTTTFELNLVPESEQYWKNVSRFNDKWNVEVFTDEELKSKSRFGQLLTLDQVVNPVYPEESVVSRFEELFTDEVKTEILKSDHDPDTLCQLVHLMMVMDQREVMRRLEDKLNNVDLPASLIYQLVRFYFNKNIYSRCNHYLDRLSEEQQSLQSELYRLEILVNEKELDNAIPKLKELLDQAPSNPTLYKLTGDIHRFDGNEEEALSFYKIANQINPFEYSMEGEEELRL